MFILRAVGGGVRAAVRGGKKKDDADASEQQPASAASQKVLVEEEEDEGVMEGYDTQGNVVQVTFSGFAQKTHDSLSNLYISKKDKIAKGFKLGDNLVVHNFLGGGWQVSLLTLSPPFPAALFFLLLTTTLNNSSPSPSITTLFCPPPVAQACGYVAQIRTPPHS